MADSLLQRALHFAVANERIAESTYKGWMLEVPSERMRSVLAELGGAERSHHEMLLHVSVADIVSRRVRPLDDAGIAALLVEMPASPRSPTPAALASAVRREEVLAALYGTLADLGGETASLFRAMAAEERRHQELLRTLFDAAGDTSPAARCT